MAKYIEALLISTLAVFAPINTVLEVVLVLILCDLLTGLIASRKAGIKITSSGLRRTISKIVVYELALIAGFLAEKYLMGDLLPVVKLLGGLIGATELKSVLENANIISGTNLFEALIGKLGSDNQKPKD
jgi:phage-related holin